MKGYPVPYALAEEMDKEVIEMRRLGVIEPSTSYYTSPPAKKQKQLKIYIGEKINVYIEKLDY